MTSRIRLHSRLLGIASLGMLFTAALFAAAPEPKPGPELLLNGALAQGTDDWKLETHVGSQATLTVVEKAFEEKPALDVTVEDTGTEKDLWAVQLTQGGLSFKQGEKYRLTFAAKSSNGVWAFATLGETVPPYGSVSAGSQITLRETWQKFTFDLTVTKDAPHARLIFTNLNRGGQTISFSNISLTALK